MTPSWIDTQDVELAKHLIHALLVTGKRAQSAKLKATSQSWAQMLKHEVAKFPKDR